MGNMNHDTYILHYNTIVNLVHSIIKLRCNCYDMVCDHTKDTYCTLVT